MSKLLVALIASAFALVSRSALGDDKMPSFDGKQVDHGSDPYGATPARMPKGTPLVGDFDGKDRQRVITPEEKAATKKAKRAEMQKQLENQGKLKERGWTVEDAYRQEKPFITKKQRTVSPADKPTNEERQKALTDQSKKGSGQ